MIAGALGHRDLRSTLRYLALHRKRLMQAIEAAMLGLSNWRIAADDGVTKR